MRAVEDRIASLRHAWRLLAARRGVRSPVRLRPARLVLRLDDGDLPPGRGRASGEDQELSPQDWQQALVSAVAWLGPLPVTVRALRTAATPLAADLVRFAHRMECQTTLVSDGSGITAQKAEELVDRGLSRMRIAVGGVSAKVHGAVVGGDLDAAVGAVTAAVAARIDRGARLDVEIAVPWLVPVETELRAVIGWARQAGANGLRLVAPFLAEGLPADPELLDSLVDRGDPFQRTSAQTIQALHAMAAHCDGEPGLARSHASACLRRCVCPVGGQRLELTAGGALFCCPFKPPIHSHVGAEPAASALDIHALWLDGRAHLQEIHSCDRTCAHPELAPA